MFPDDTEGAFAAYRFFEAVGFVLGYVYNSAICMDLKIYILMAFHIVGSLLYYVTEYIHLQMEGQRKIPANNDKILVDQLFGSQTITTVNECLSSV